MRYPFRAATVQRWIYRHTFSAKDRMAFYEQLAFLLDNNRPLQQVFLDMRNVVTDFGRKLHPYAVLLDDFLAAVKQGQGALEQALLAWLPSQEATLIGSGILAGKLSDALRRASQIVEGKESDDLSAAGGGGLSGGTAGAGCDDDAYDLPEVSSAPGASGAA